MAKPIKAYVRTYQVGFGDCFLLSIAYDDASERHVLIDFGSTKLPPGAPKSRMTDIANNIAERCNNKLTAIIATHRHQDHISGFAPTANGKGPGAIIAACDPELVIQPWTEHPDLPVDATEEAATSPLRGMAAETRSLAAMQGVADNYAAEARRNHQYLRSVSRELKDELSFIGEDNIANPKAVRNLMAMGRDKGRSEYLRAGDATALAGLLGVEIDVLGPPTVKQREGVKLQRSRNEGEYWHLAANAARAIKADHGQRAAPLFPNHVRARTEGNFPIEARWLIYRMRKMRGTQMLQIVRMLDKAMNNTSLILLFRVGSKSLLFPGDAQYENWAYALEQDEWMQRLAQVDLYKVGHHGSLNATPRTLWAKFGNKSDKVDAASRLETLMSTLEGKHGHASDDTEVPRETLVTELGKYSNLFTTQSLAGDAYWHDSELDVR